MNSKIPGIGSLPNGGILAAFPGFTPRPQQEADMPTLKAHREAEFLPKYQSLPPTVQTKICLLEKLFETAILYLKARESAPVGVPDFDSLLRDIAKNMANATQKNLVDELRKGGAGDHYLGFQYDYWIKILGDSRYRPLPDLVHLAYMLAALWIYWLNWPYDRNIFEEGKEICIRNLALAATPKPAPPPSAPSFEATLDHSLVWLAKKVGTETANIQHWGKRKEGVAQTNLKKKLDAAVKKNYIFEIYHLSSKIKIGMNLSTIAKIIADVFKERQTRQDDNKIAKDIDPPSIYQIKRYLDGNEKIMRDFNPVGRRRIKQT
jgi:hypothetical protein